MMGMPIPNWLSLQGSQDLSEERILPGPGCPRWPIIGASRRSPDGMRPSEAVGSDFRAALEKRRIMAKTISKSSLEGGAGGRLIGVKQAAAYLGISIWTMRERIWAGDVPFVRFPGYRRQLLDVRDLEKLIQNNKINFDY
jgi:hypothetical protein